MVSVSQDTVPVVIYNGLQQMQLYVLPRNSQPYKIIILLLSSNQNLHPTALWISALETILKISLVYSSQELVMQNFDI